MRTTLVLLATLALALVLDLGACGGSGAGTDTPDGSTTDDAGTNQNNNAEVPAPIVDTGQDNCYSATQCFDCPGAGGAMYGQDAQYRSAQPSYLDNSDGTVTDLVTGLMWQQAPGAKMDYSDAINGASLATTGGYDDWRVPTVKELYSLINFSGEDPDPLSTSTGSLTPFIDDSVFGFEYGDTSTGDRIIDSQWVTSSIYTSTVMTGEECFFGLNFADGRIKCYPTMAGKGYFVIYVRGSAQYGVNSFTDNGDGTVSDASTGLMWMQSDNAQGVNWESALAYCEDASLAGHDDWRLPNAKELQSLVDYSRSPDYTSSPAIDSIFDCTGITNEAGQADWPFYWSSTTHKSASGTGGSAIYVAFGRALGDMGSGWIDVHGAGAQRSDPKDGNASDYPQSFGPQGDVLRVFNYVRCVRDGGVALDVTGTSTECDGGSGEVVDCADANPGDPCCGDDECLSPETETNCPADCTTTGPTPCTDTADCQVAGACPPDAALGCTCEPPPMGTDNICVPNCVSDTDCPSPPPGMTFTCSGGICIPS